MVRLTGPDESEDTMKFNYKIVAPVTFESERALGFDVVLVEEHSAQRKEVRVFIPKSQIRDNHMSDWIARKKIQQHVMEWTNDSPPSSGCFYLEGLCPEPLFY